MRLRGQDITRLPAYRIARMGMARTFQNIRLFGQLSVIDNVKAALQDWQPSCYVYRWQTSTPWRDTRSASHMRGRGSGLWCSTKITSTRSNVPSRKGRALPS